MDHKISKDMISSGMIPSGEKTQADLGRTQYGSAPSPSSLMDSYRKIYEHHQKDADGKVIEHEEEEIKEMSGGGAGTGTKVGAKPNTNTKPNKPSKPDMGSDPIVIKDKPANPVPDVPKPSKPTKDTKADKVKSNVLSQDVDLFDIIKGRLLDEGADEEEALKIMANISQEDFDKLKEDITLTKGDYASRNTKTSAYAIGKSKGFKGYKAGGGLGADFLPRV